MHLGLEQYADFVLYSSGILAFILSVFWRPIVGLCYLMPLIPLQTLRYRMNDLPLGESIIDVILLGVALGLLRRKQWIVPRTPLTRFLCFYAIFTFVCLCMGSFYLNRPLPLSIADPRFAEWKSYMTMPAIFFLVVASVTETRQIKLLLVLMCMGVLLLNKSFWGTVSDRDFSTYSDDLREAGGMGYAGVNGLAAFEAQYATALLALSGFERKRLLKFGYLGLAIFSAMCLMFSLSRAGYAAFLTGWLFIGIFKERKLLILLLVFCLCWTGLVPGAVSSRVLETYDGDTVGLDHSSETRMTLWEDALKIFQQNPVFGTGFDTYEYMGRVGTYKDTHNIFVKVLVETGIVGLLLFLWMLAKMFWMGYRVFRHAQNPLHASVGLALVGWVACAAVANFFGDRWTFLQVNGYLWVIAGLVVRAADLDDNTTKSEVETANLESQSEGLLEPANA